MSDLFSNPSFFFAGANPNVPQDLRQKLALALLLQKRKAPSNFGEGLSAIGDAIGDRSVMRQIESEAAGAEQTSQTAYDRLTNGGALQQPQPSTLATPPPVQAATVAAGSNPSLYTPGQPPTDQTPVPGDVQEGSPQQGMLLRPGNRSAMMQPGAAAPAPQAAPTRSMVQESVPPDAPIRTNPDGTIAGNLSSPQVLPPPTGGGAPPPPGRPTVADFGQKLALAPTPTPAAPPTNFPPVVAMGGEPRPEDPRREATMALLRQQMGGGQTRAAAPPAPIPQPPPDQGIAAAPPTVPPIAKAPPPQQVAQGATPGYVTPAPAERAPPPTMTKKMQDIQNIIQNTPASQRETMAKKLQPLYDQEKDKVAQAHKTWDSDRTQDRLLAVEREKQLADQAKRIADVDKTRHDISVGKIIQSEGRIFRAQDDGSVKDITPGQTGDGPPQIKMTQDQSDTVKFYRMGVKAASQLEGKERVLAEGWKDELAGKVPFAGNKLLSSQYRAAKNAAGLLVQADLRDSSGATIGTQEFKDRFDLLIPRSGDDELAMRNKAEARRAVLEGQRLALGTARPMADYVDKEHAKERAEKMSTLNREMEGKDKSKTYEKNGIFRKWNGTAWEEH